MDNAEKTPRITQQQARRSRKRRLAIQQIDPQRVNLNAAFDYAESSPELNELFGRALHESGLTSFDRQTRRTLVDRSRYEILQANEWFNGAARQAVNWVIGRGPFLEVKLEGNSPAARQVERLFNAWFKSVNGARKMRVMAWAKITDGTGFAMITNKAIPESATPQISLNFVPFEEEQITAPVGSITGEKWNTQYLLDGIELDSQGDPVRYHILPAHPADEFSMTTTPISAEYVISVWQWVRPSQKRGYPELATSIGKGPMMRVYDRAVIDSAATAAKHTVLIETAVDRFEDGEVAYDPVDPDVQMQIGYGMQTFLPAGHKATQLKPEQPTSSHDKFTRTNVAAAARPLGQPAQIATGDASGMNFAGGQLGRQDYELDVDVQRQDWELHCLDKLLKHFLEEAVLLGLIPAAVAAQALDSHEWRWTRRRHQDTNREYAGRQKACQSGLTSPAFWQEDDGVDPEEEDLAAARSYGITVEQFREARFRTLFPEASMAILGPGRGTPPTSGRPPGDPQNV